MVAKKRKIASSEEEEVYVPAHSSSEEEELPQPAPTSARKTRTRKPPAATVLSDSEEEEKPARKKRKTTRTRKGTEIAFEGEGEMPKTKKAAAAARRAKRQETVYRIAGNEKEPVREISSEDHVADLYQNLSLSQLKEWLRVNHAPLVGIRHELVQRCIDGHINGRIPVCERCQKGKIHFDLDRALYVCPGFFDDDAKMFIKCTFAEPKVERLPWLNPEENHPEEDSGTAEEEAKVEETSLSIPQAVLDKIANASGAKDVAEIVTMYCKEELKLSLPSDEKKARTLVGGALMSTRHTDEEGKLQFDVPRVVLQMKQAHPPSTVGHAPSVSTHGKSKCEANEPIASLLEEIAVWEKKKGGENVGFKIRALKTAAMAIRGVPTEITDGNALGSTSKKNGQKLAGIGKGTAKMIQEFLDNDKKSSPYLDVLKREVGEE